MPDSTRRANAVTTPECRLQECGYCRPGPVTTSYGDVVMDVKCDHDCHPRRADGQFVGRRDLPPVAPSRHTGGRK